jgi:hypothetical protein
MPEFEETQHRPDPSKDYAPGEESASANSDAAKPRSRRRSQGFKKTPAVANETPRPQPTVEVTTESQPEQPAPKSAADTEPAQTPATPEVKDTSASESKNAAPHRSFPEDDANPQPSAETLARISEIEARLTTRKAERNSKRQSRPKPRNTESSNGSRPEGSPSKQRRNADRGGRSNTGKGRGRPSGNRSRSAPTSKEPGLLKKLTGFFGGLFNREQPLPEEPELPPQVASGKAPARPDGSGSGRRRSGSGGRRRGGNGPSRGANNSRHRGRAPANRKD